MSDGHGVYCKRDTSLMGETKKRLHLTQKPVGIMQWCLEFTPKQASILDPFSGSFTTGIACEIIGRRCYAMEVAEQYVDVGICRWQDLVGKEARHAVSGQTFLETMASRAKPKRKSNARRMEASG